MMLSAIAARRAAQAASWETSEKLEIIESSNSEQQQQQQQQYSSNPNSKRKPSLQKTPNTSKRTKKEKDKEKRVKETGYFQKPQRNIVEDLIILDPDDEESSAMSEDQESYQAPVTLGPLNERKPSPSWDLDDSSADEADGVEENGEEEGDAMINNPPSTSQLPTDKPDILSTFQSTPDQNVFFLTSDQVDDLHISSSSSPGTLLALQPGEKLCLLGTYTFCVLKGSVSLCGTKISASRQTHRVFAPRSSPLPILEGLSGIDTIDGPKLHVPGHFHSIVDTQVVLVLLQELKTGVEGLGRVCRTFDGVFEPSRWQKNDVLRSSLRIPDVHIITHQTKDIQAFRLPQSWEMALSSLPTGSPDNSNSGDGVYLVTGPKKSGKSTFARTLVNKLLAQYQRVAFLECDPGQSEFTPGGMIALNVVHNPIFGPPFTHPTLPVTAHYLGATSPRSSPSHYLAAIQAAIEAYRLDVQIPSTAFPPNEENVDVMDDDIKVDDFIPLVINTMGWTKGLGADLNRKIRDMVQPTHVYEIESDSSASEGQPWPPPLKTISDPYPYPGHEMKLHLLTAIPQSVLSTNYTATDHRTLSTLSYFYAVFPPPSPFRPHSQADTPLTIALSNSNLIALTWDTSLPLLARPPYEVDSHVFRNIVLTGAGSEDVVPAEVGMVLNAAVVGLVACQFDSELALDNVPLGSANNETTHVGIPYTQGRNPPSPTMSSCLGIALIRSTSESMSVGRSPSDQPPRVQMHILTPLPAMYLAQATVVVKGEMELPVWGWLDHRIDVGDGAVGLEQGKVPYLQWGKGAVGGVRRRVRRNLMRRGQM